MPAFSVQVHDLLSRRPVVRVCGEIDIATASELADCVAGVLTHDPLALVVDLTETTFLDCSGVGVVIATRNHLAETSRPILRRPRPFIRNVLEILEIDTIALVD